MFNLSRFSFHSDIIAAQVVARHGRLEVGSLLKLTVLGSNQKKSSKKFPNYWETSWLRLPFFVCKTIFFVTQKVGMFSKIGPSPTPNLSGRFWEGWVELKRGGWVWDSQRWNFVSRWWVNKYFLEFSPLGR